jgi:cysteinyl-tRNA synthetase
MVDARETARKQRDWGRADQLRQQIAELGWTVADSPTGPKLEKK